MFTKADLQIKQYIRTLSATWIVNLIGSIITTVLLAQILHPDVSKIVTSKLSLTPMQMLVSSIFCNILVCAAVYNYREHKNHIVSGFFIMCFVIMGFEHSVASMSYMTLGYVQGVGINMFKLISYMTIVSLGNIIGGRLVYSVVQNNK